MKNHVELSEITIEINHLDFLMASEGANQVLSTASNSEVGTARRAIVFGIEGAVRM
jgi:hypothetical protein